MIDESIYHEYANWATAFEPLIKKLIDINSPFSIIFKHVYEVCDYFYNELIDNKDYAEYQDDIFRTASEYCGGIVGCIDEILKEVYNNNFNELEKNAKTISFYIQVSDIIYEALPLINDKNFNFDEYYDYQDILFEDFISQKKEITEEITNKFNSMLDKILLTIDPNFRTINDILLEVAEDCRII